MKLYRVVYLYWTERFDESTSFKDCRIPSNVCHEDCVEVEAETEAQARQIVHEQTTNDITIEEVKFVSKE